MSPASWIWVPYGSDSIEMEAVYFDEKLSLSLSSFINEQL